MSVAAGGKTSMRLTRGSASAGPAAPAATQSRKIWYSSEPSWATLRCEIHLSPLLLCSSSQKLGSYANSGLELLGRGQMAGAGVSFYDIEDPRGVADLVERLRDADVRG